MRRAISKIGSRRPRGVGRVVGRSPATQDAAGCPHCGSTWALIDDCAVCSGAWPCAWCLFGPGVEDDEAHALLALEG